MKRVKHIREELANKKPDEKGMLEIVAAQFVADEPSVFGTPNHDWHARELDWYNSMSLKVGDIPPPVPSIWAEVSAEDGSVNSNYGWCIYSAANGNQYKKALETLEKDLYSRQAVMIYTRPSMHEDSTRGGMHDFMCTNTVQLLIREGIMTYVVNMRSSDAVYGYKGDWAWHDHVFGNACDHLGVSKGDMVWNAGSFHVYPRHLKLVAKWLDDTWEDAS